MLADKDVLKVHRTKVGPKFWAEGGLLRGRTFQLESPPGSLPEGLSTWGVLWEAFLEDSAAEKSSRVVREGSPDDFPREMSSGKPSRGTLEDFSAAESFREAPRRPPRTLVSGRNPRAQRDLDAISRRFSS